MIPGVRGDFVKYHLPLCAWAALIIFGSSLPQGRLLPVPFFVSRLAHFVEYGVLGFLLIRSFRRFSKREGLAVFCVLSGAGFLFALLDELYQGVVPGRHTELGDWLVDASGVCIGIVLKGVLWRR
ncbi:MAG: VanZ family protein [Candidatus Omnitrophota bacterium]